MFFVEYRELEPVRFYSIHTAVVQFGAVSRGAIWPLKSIVYWKVNNGSQNSDFCHAFSPLDTTQNACLTLLSTALRRKETISSLENQRSANQRPSKTLLLILSYPSHKSTEISQSNIKYALKVFGLDCARVYKIRELLLAGEQGSNIHLRNPWAASGRLRCMSLLSTLWGTVSDFYFSSKIAYLCIVHKL